MAQVCRYLWRVNSIRRRRRGVTTTTRLDPSFLTGEMFSERQAAAIGVTITLIALLAILISVPYWRAIGLL